MRPETVIFLAVGVIFAIVGLLIWKRQKIDLVHSYHHNRVREKDKKAYCSLVGKGVFVIGTGLLAGALLNEVIGMQWFRTGFAVGFAIGIVMMVVSTKYNK